MKNAAFQPLQSSKSRLGLQWRNIGFQKGHRYKLECLYYISKSGQENWDASEAAETDQKLVPKCIQWNEILTHR